MKNSIEKIFKESHINFLINNYNFLTLVVMKNTYLILFCIVALLSLGYTSGAQNVNIPDATFKAYLVGNALINTNSDTEIQVSEATVFTGTIDVNGLGISDLTGIETFVALTELNCRLNSLSSLNINPNTALTNLNCSNNLLGSLDVSTNTALTKLFCSSNSLSNLIVSTNTALIELYCASNSLGSLDVSANIALTSLSCGANSLNNLDVSNLTSLGILACQSNSISNLDVSTNTALFWLVCGNNSLSSLDINNNTSLGIISCEGNSLVNLDVSQNTALTSLKCQNNSLTSLDVRNGNNSSITTFNASGNSSLSCISVSDVAFATTNWTDIDAGVSFSIDCSAAPEIVIIPDANFKAYLVGNAAINTNSDTEIQVSEGTVFTGTIDVNNMSISDLTGIEAFIALTELQCNNNSLSNLDLNTNTALTNLDCSSNSLSSLDISTNTALTSIKCDNNSLNSLDVSTNTTLTYLDCKNNSFLSLDLSTNTALTTLDCSSNSLTNIDVSLNTALITFACNGNTLTSLDVSSNTALGTLYCNTNSLNSLDVRNGNNSGINNFDATGNTSLSCISVSDVAYATSNWTNIDVGASFDTDCYVAPVITSAATVNAAENQTSVLTVTATDANAGDTQTYSISGGEDQTLFSINPSTGELTFVTAPDWEAPADANADNDYVVEITVTDATALTDVQILTITVTDVNEIPGVEVVLGGYILTQNSDPLAGVDVELTGATNQTTTTDEFGWYSFSIMSNQAYHITPLFDTDSDDGVTTLDIAIMYWHLLGRTDYVMSKYDLIASDVNDSKSLTSLDVSETRAVILHQNDKFRDRNAVEFINKDYTGTNDVFDYKNYLDITPTQSELNLNFTAVKLGDSGENWNVNSSGARIQHRDEIEFVLEEKLLSGNKVSVPIKAQNFTNMIGLQFTLEWDADIYRFENLSKQNIELISNIDLVDKGLLTVTWNSNNIDGLTLDNNTILSNIEFTTLNIGDATINISSALTPALAFNSTLETISVKSKMSLNDDLIQHELSIYPNPTSDYIYVKSGAQANFTNYMILNTIGNQVQVGEFDLGKRISISKLTPGVYILKLIDLNGKVYASELFKQ